MYVCGHDHVHAHVRIRIDLSLSLYIYIKRERERDVHMCICMYTYVCEERVGGMRVVLCSVVLCCIVCTSCADVCVFMHFALYCAPRISMYI